MRAIYLFIILIPIHLITILYGQSTKAIDEATSLIHTRKPEKALPILNEVLDKAPEDSVALPLRARVYRDLDQHELALADLDRLIDDHRTKNHYALELRAKIHFANGRHLLAEKDIAKAIEMAPGEVIYLAVQSKILYKLGKKDQAFQNLNRLQAVGDSALAWHFRGDLLFWEGRYPEAKVNYEKAQKAGEYYFDQHSMWVALYHNLAFCYGLTKEHEKAIESISSAIKLDPQNSHFYLVRGVAYYEFGKLDLAHKDISKSIKLDPTNGELLHMRGLLRKKMNDKEGACKDFRESVKLGYSKAEIDLILECE